MSIHDKFIHTKEITESTRTIFREQSSDDSITNSQISSRIQQFISSASLIFAITHDSKLTSQSSFVNRLIFYLSAAILSTILQFYTSYHLLTNPKIIAKSAIEAFLIVFELISQYFIYLLIGLIRDQLSKSVSQDYWDDIHIAPLIIIVLLYYALTSVGKHLLNRQVNQNKKINNKK